MLLALAGPALRRFGLRRVQGALASLAPWRPRTLDGGQTLPEARRLARLVDGAARLGPANANCLERSLVLWWLLRRRGLSSELRIGVRRRPGSPSGAGTLDFHAWIEHDGAVVNDASDVRARFATFDRPIAPSGVHWR